MVTGKFVWGGLRLFYHFVMIRLNLKLLKLSQYCKELMLLQISKVEKLKMKKNPNLTIPKLNMVMGKTVLSKSRYISNLSIPLQ